MGPELYERLPRFAPVTRHVLRSDISTVLQKGFLLPGNIIRSKGDMQLGYRFDLGDDIMLYCGQFVQSARHSYRARSHHVELNYHGVPNTDANPDGGKRLLTNRSPV